MVLLKFLLFEGTTLARVRRACKKNFWFYWCNRCSTRSSCPKADLRLTGVSFSFVQRAELCLVLISAWVDYAQSRRFSIAHLTRNVSTPVFRGSVRKLCAHLFTRVLELFHKRKCLNFHAMLSKKTHL